ncbi:unnamed protein product, partial [Brenthis ino]
MKYARIVMSQSSEPDADVTSNRIAYNALNHSHKRILRSKENQFKTKCNKELRKKLKKYKLRKDGNEDPEVLNVSQILVNSLRIKSPNSQNKQSGNNLTEGEVLKPSNYLFKMVRKRRNCNQLNSLQINGFNSATVNINVPDTKPNFLEEEAQNRKQMDAFKLMMDSRNKSIGRNSPGKEKCCNDLDLQELMEKKEIKAKRMLSLQKMAEDKGAINKKEIEEYRDKCVKNKMLKRAERLKDMIHKPELKVDKKEKTIPDINLTTKLETEYSNNDSANNSNSSSPKLNTLKLCDIFSNTTAVVNENKLVKKISEEDIDFLNKLSPSLRKKENMLCYFKKLNKEKEKVSEEAETNDQDQSENNCDYENKHIIKVKFTPKRKKKKIQQPVLGNPNNKSNEECNLMHSDLNESIIDIGDSRKRKRNVNIDKSSQTTIDSNDLIEPNNEGRPKRNSKMPVKYTEDVNCFSSDEELHIFTPKKKRNKELNSKVNIIENVKEEKNIVLNSINNKTHKTTKNNNNQKLVDQPEVKTKLKKKDTGSKKKSKNHTNNDKEKKAIKLAPIFVSKPQLSQEAIEAKKNFLKSGVPEKLKKNIVQTNTTITGCDSFNSVVHVQQLDPCKKNFELKDWFQTSHDDADEINNVNNSNSFFKQLLTLSSTESKDVPSLKQKSDKILKNIKTSYPKFPVYRTYHLLKGKSKGEFKDCNYPDLDNSFEIINNFTDLSNETLEKLNWCEKYKPTSSKQIIGNFDSIKELKRWLESWTEKLIKAKNNGSDASDMSDFYCSDTDSRDAQKNSNNVLIITGQTGSGKTSAVYAVAAELAIKVIEVNASSKRNGKIMIQDLQEATQSHKVNRAKSSDCSQKSQEVPMAKVKKRGRPKKSKEDTKVKNPITPVSLTPVTPSQESIRTGMSLILIDDADIVFDQDDGFCSAISQLIHSSKRPVILVTSSLSCLHLQRFLQNGKVIHMRPLLPRMLGTWLDIMCLVDVGMCYTGLGAQLLDFNKGDIRKTINYLQFYMNSFKVNQIEDVVLSQVKCNLDDENSNISWADSEGFEGPSNEIQSMTVSAIDKRAQKFSCDSFNIFNLWWSLPSYINNYNISNGGANETKEKYAGLQKMADMLDMISAIDHLDHIKPDRRFNIATRPWYTNENPSLLEIENLDDFDSAFSINKDIMNVLMTSTIAKAQELCSENTVNIRPPSMSMQRERDRTVSRHKTLSSYLNPSAVLDRRATALDYWPSCRTLCRLEKNKTDSNIKRNNRFCHYLKSLNVLCKNDFFDSLADSLT